MTHESDGSKGDGTIVGWDRKAGSPGTGPAPNGVGGEIESQINIKGDRAEIERFRRLAKRDGYRLIGLLRRALDAYEREVAAGYLHFRR